MRACYCSVPVFLLGVSPAWWKSWMKSLGHAMTLCSRPWHLFWERGRGLLDTLGWETEVLNRNPSSVTLHLGPQKASRPLQPSQPFAGLSHCPRHGKGWAHQGAGVCTWRLHHGESCTCPNDTGLRIKSRMG
jgi:hypothetical protein